MMRSVWTKPLNRIIGLLASAKEEKFILTGASEELSSKTVLDAHQRVVASPVANTHSIDSL